MSKRCTKSDLENILYKQLENLNAMHDLLGIMKFQNDLIHNINQTLREEIGQFKKQQVMYPTRRRQNLKSMRLAFPQWHTTFSITSVAS